MVIVHFELVTSSKLHQNLIFEFALKSYISCFCHVLAFLDFRETTLWRPHVPDKQHVPPSGCPSGWQWHKCPIVNPASLSMEWEHGLGGIGRLAITLTPLPPRTHTHNHTHKPTHNSSVTNHFPFHVQLRQCNRSCVLSVFVVDFNCVWGSHTVIPWFEKSSLRNNVSIWKWADSDVLYVHVWGVIWGRGRLCYMCSVHVGEVLCLNSIYLSAGWSVEVLAWGCLRTCIFLYICSRRLQRYQSKLVKQVAVLQPL